MEIIFNVKHYYGDIVCYYINNNSLYRCIFSKTDGNFYMFLKVDLSTDIISYNQDSYHISAFKIQMINENFIPNTTFKDNMYFMDIEILKKTCIRYLNLSTIINDI